MSIQEVLTPERRGNETEIHSLSTERYCSKECQQRDWPKHKHHCIKESPTGERGPTVSILQLFEPTLEEITPVSDREFARERAELEVRRDIRSLFERVQKNPALQTKQHLMFQVDFTTLDRNISIGIAPGGRTDKTESERSAAIYAKVQSGRQLIQSLGLVTGWKELQTSSQPENIFFPEKFRKMIK